MINFKQYISEARMAPLYHGTFIRRLHPIFSTNSLGFPAGVDKFVSLSRSYNYARRWAGPAGKGESTQDGVVLQLDQQKLAQRYKIRPVNYWANAEVPGIEGKFGTRQLKDRESELGVLVGNEYEERIPNGIKNVDKYITAIYAYRGQSERVKENVPQKFHHLIKERGYR